MTAIQCGAWEHCMQAGWNHANNEDICADCKEVVTILIRIAKESTLKTCIQKYLDDECDTIPLQTLIPSCQELVDTLYSRFITALEEQINPSTVCAKLSLCQSDSLETKDIFHMLVPEMEQQLQLLRSKGFILPNSHTQDNPKEELPIPLPLCWLCRSFIGRAESYIPKAAIGQALSQLCLVMPSAVAGMCQCLVERYTVIIVDMILGKLGPSLICGIMFSCATEENCDPEIPRVPLSAPVANCQACLTLITQAKATLKANSSKTEMEAAVLAACSSTFSSWEECKRFIYQHQPKLFTLLTKPWNAQSTCQELEACVAEENPFPGTTACAQGPTYWCSSPRAAEQCKAVQHCQNHVWL
ncbi:pulmonary surfactant-associated protein B [Rhineura floridana]|uniref:pulmonary surfactant-associated protein B n=1 Tax=Rhineura floridana TaxID=261503 RepID=UPI002AC80494|nr:pulmonary surfactant-associated protein B [Rhineura floridana]